MKERFALSALALACACGAPQPAAPNSQAHTPHPATVSRAQAFEAVLQIEAKPGEKRLQGVWLERADGQRWIIAYRAEPCWRPFAGRRVRARGETYQPEGQAVLATHFRVRALELVDPKAEPMAELIALGDEQVLSGSFQQMTWPAGSKLEGESQLVFERSDGTRYFLSGVPQAAPAAGQRVEVRAREATPSPYMAHPGGPHLFVLEVLRN